MTQLVPPPRAKLDVRGGIVADGNVEVGGTVNATGFNGTPWISPQWNILGAQADRAGNFPGFGTAGASKYRTPFDVTILGATVSGNWSTNGFNFSIRLYVDGALAATTTASAIADWDSVNQSFPSPQNVSAGQVIHLECGSGNGSGDLTVVFYGRTNE